MRTGKKFVNIHAKLLLPTLRQFLPTLYRRRRPSYNDAMPNAIESITTARLVAAPISEAHFPEINRLHTDPQVMRTLSADGKPLSEEKTREHIRQTVEHWHRYGFGLWIFNSKTTGKFIGRGGLKIYQIDGKDVNGLAYAVMPDYWNRGFATEMAAASLEVGFGPLGFTQIDSWTLPINLASQRVMEKLRFRYERDFDFVGLGHRYYRLTKGEWEGHHLTAKNNFPPR